MAALVEERTRRGRWTLVFAAVAGAAILYLDVGFGSTFQDDDNNYDGHYRHDGESSGFFRRRLAARGVRSESLREERRMERAKERRVARERAREFGEEVLALEAELARDLREVNEAAAAAAAAQEKIQKESGSVGNGIGRGLLFGVAHSFADYMDPKSVALREEEAREARASLFDGVQAPGVAGMGLVAVPDGAQPPATFRVHPLSPSDGSEEVLVPSEMLIEVLDPRPDCKYSVTVVSHNKYTGTARLLSQERSMTVDGRVSIAYAWRPVFPGEFAVVVHEVDQVYEHETPPINPSPLPIYVNEGENAGGSWKLELEDRIQNTPPCQTIPRTDLYSHWDGDWLGPDFRLEESIRTGWSFLPWPGMGCKIETYSTEALRAIPEKKRIVILGRSVERGIFLSLTDLLLDKMEKKNLKKSIVGKCWGRASVSKGNLELMYQDFRVNSFEDPTQPQMIECHNDRMVKQPGSSFIGNATMVWEEIFSTEESEWPTVVFLVCGYGAVKFMFDHHVKYFVDNLPAAWEGTLFLGDFEFSARGAGFMDAEHYQSYLNTIAGYVAALNDPRVRWIDGPGISREMRMYGQKHEKFVARSQHFHHPCMLKDPDDPQTKAMVVCSNVTEMVGQLLLGHALGPKVEFAESIRSNPDRTPSDTGMRWCHACPQCMIPFSITPRPEMECVDGPFVAKTENADCSSVRSNTHDKKAGKKGKKSAEVVVTDPMLCPDACMETAATDSFGTESDTVYVRQCPI